MRLRAVVLIIGLTLGCSLFFTSCSFSGLLSPPRPTSVYLGSSDKNVYAFDAAAGTFRWKQAIGGEVHSTPLSGSMALGVSDQVIVGATDGVLYSLAGADGHVLWHTQLVPPQSAPQYGRQIFTTPVFMPGEVFVASKYQGTIYALNLLTGKLDNSASLGSDTVQWLTASRDLKSIYVNAENLEIYAFHNLGNRVWTQPSVKIEGPMIQGIDDVLLGHGGSTFYALDPATGNVLNTAPLPNHGESVATNPDKFVGFNYATVSGGEVTGIAPPAAPFWTTNPLHATSWLAPRARWGVFIGSVDGQLASIDGRNGGIVWQQKIDSDLAGPPLIAPLDVNSIRLVAVSMSGHLYGLDASNGKTLWQQTVGGTVDAIPSADAPY